MIKNLLKFLFLFLCLETFSRENLRGLLITNNPTEKVTESSPWARSYLKKICETEHSRSPCPQQLLDYLHQAPQEEINFFKAALQKELYSSMQKSTAKTISFCEDPPEELREKVSQEQRILTLNEALQKSIFCSSYENKKAIFRQSTLMLIDRHDKEIFRSSLPYKYAEVTALLFDDEENLFSLHNKKTILAWKKNNNYSPTLFYQSAQEITIINKSTEGFLLATNQGALIELLPDTGEQINLYDRKNSLLYCKELTPQLILVIDNDTNCLLIHKESRSIVYAKKLLENPSKIKKIITHNTFVYHKENYAHENQEVIALILSESRSFYLSIQLDYPEEIFNISLLQLILLSYLEEQKKNAGLLYHKEPCVLNSDWFSIFMTLPYQLKIQYQDQLLHQVVPAY